MNPPDDDLLAELAELPRRDADPATAERVHRAAARAFVRAHTPTSPIVDIAARAGRAITPLGLAGTVVLYLGWAVSAANALFP